MRACSSSPPSVLCARKAWYISRVRVCGRGESCVRTKCVRAGRVAAVEPASGGGGGVYVVSRETWGAGGSASFR